MIECYIPVLPVATAPSEQLVTAPRMNDSREKIVWSADGAVEYEKLVTPALSSLRCQKYIDIHNHLSLFSTKSKNVVFCPRVFWPYQGFI